MSWKTTWQSWSKDTSPGSIENCRKQTTLKCRERFETESESSRVYSLTSSSKYRQGSKPSPQTEQPSGPRSTESVRHSGSSSMKTPHWLSAFAPCFVTKKLPSHRFSKPSAWRSRPLCLRSPAVGKCAGPGSQATLQERFERVGEKKPTGPWACPD